MKTKTETKAVHTAGPLPLKILEPVYGGPSIVITNQWNHYATTYDPSAARLIASAPDLLAAAKAISEAFKHSKPFEHGSEAEKALDMIDAVIAIAEGKGEK